MKPEIKSGLHRVFTRLELQLVAVAEEMPDDKYSFRPSTGESGEVRTFGEQLRHVAAVQWVVGAALLGEKPPVDVGNGDDGPIGMTSKEDILKYVKKSFAYMGRAIAGINDDNALEIILIPTIRRAPSSHASPWLRDTRAMAGSTMGRWLSISA